MPVTERLVNAFTGCSQRLQGENPGRLNPLDSRQRGPGKQP